MITIPRGININHDPNVDFEPGFYATQELHFLANHLNMPAIAAFHEFDPEGEHKHVNRAAVEPVLSLMWELEELRKHREVPWAGYGAIREAIERYLLWQERCQEIRRRSTRPDSRTITNASMWGWDDMGHAHKYAIDADSGEMTRTEILDSGERRPFKVKLTGTPEAALTASLNEIMPWVSGKKVDVKNDRLIRGSKDKKHGYFECSVCGKREEFLLASRQAESGARARMGRHYKTAKSEPTRHRLLYTKAFRGS